MGLNAGARKYTTAEWFDEWMKLYNIGRLKNTTINGYVDGFERITDYIGSVRLESLTPAHLVIWWKDYRQMAMQKRQWSIR